MPSGRAGGALTLAVGDVIGGNTFDTLLVGVADTGMASAGVIVVYVVAVALIL